MLFYLLGPELFVKILVSQLFGDEYEKFTSAWIKNTKESWQATTKEILKD